MTPHFRGLVIGLSPSEVATVLRADDSFANVEMLGAFRTITSGYAGKRLLNRLELPDRPSTRVTIALLGIWAVTSVTVFATLGSFFLGVVYSLRFWLLLGAIGLATSAFASTFFVGRRMKGAYIEAGSGPGFDDLVVGALVADPLLGPLVVLAVLLFLFLFLVLWLPLLIFVLNLVSLGELWRSYRGALVTAEDGRVLGRMGGGLLHAGGVLSRSWDAYLNPTDRALAADRRSIHFHVHHTLLGLGASSLILAIEEILSKGLPSSAWVYIIVGTGAVVVLCFVLFLSALLRRRAERPKRARPSMGLPR